MMHDSAAETAAAPAPPRRVAIAIDGSADSVHALKWALKNVLHSTDFLYLLHVIPHEETVAAVYPGGLQAYGAFLMSEQFAKAREQAEEHAKDLVKTVGRLVKESGIKLAGMEGEIVKGVPREEIVDAVTKFNLELLIVGSRGLGVIKRSFLGSVSDYCVHHAACPVIVVRHTSE